MKLPVSKSGNQHFVTLAFVGQTILAPTQIPKEEALLEVCVCVCVWRGVVRESPT